jgi:hypothetical protein
MTNRKRPIQAETSKSLKTRLEESIAWVAIGVFTAGVLLGLAIAKDSVFTRWVGKSESPASQGNEPQISPPNGGLKSMPHVDKSPSNLFRQVESLGEQPNCNTCTITVFKISSDLIAFATNNGLVGSAYFEKSSGRYKGHAQFADGGEYWKKTLIFVELNVKPDSINAVLTPLDGGPWEVRYAK